MSVSSRVTLRKVGEEANLHEMEDLRKCIVERDATIDKLKRQFKEVISELKKVQEHSKRQSQDMLKLKETNVTSKETALKEEIEDLKLSLSRTGQQLSLLEQENEDLQIKVQTSQVQESSVETALKEEIKDLKLSLNRAGQHLSRLEQENEGLQIKVQLSQEQLQKRKTDLERMSKELEEQNMQLQEEKAELQERMKAESQDQKVALQVSFEQAMKKEKSRHEREMADMAAAHQQEIETKQAEVETFQKKLIEKEAQVYQLEQDHFIQSTETEPGENGHSLLEVNQGVESAQSPQPRQTARLNDLADQYKKDFDEERRDRERLKDQFDEEHVTTVGVMQTTNEDYKMLKGESRLKDELLQGAQMEINDLKIEIEEKRKLEEEVKAKTAQVKQYQKKIDAMQNQLSAAQKYKVASKSEGPQHQQEEQLEKAQLEMVQYKSKLEQVEEELSTLQQHISSKDLEHKEKIDSMTSELQRLHQEKSALEEQLERMQSGQHQLLQESNKQLAEARLQREEMAPQLSEQKQQQHRREAQLVKEGMESNRQLKGAAYSESDLGCWQLEMQVDSALDQLDVLLQQKEVLIQELYNQGIQIPFQEPKVSHKYQAEAQLQKEEMASQLRKQQQWQRRVGEVAPKQFPPAYYTELVFKCQELERQLDSALDQLDGLSQQKEVLVQELHNHGIKIPYEDSKEAGPTYEVQKVEGLVEKRMKVEEDVRSVKGEEGEMEGRFSGRLKEMESDLKDVKSLLKDLLKAKQDTKE